MDFLDALKEYGPWVILALMGAGILLSNSRSNEQQSKNMGAVIKFASSISGNTQAVENAIKSIAQAQEKQVERMSLTLTATIADTVAKAAIKAEESRQKWARSVDAHFVTLFAKVEDILKRMEAANGKEQSAEQLENLAKQLEAMTTEIRDRWVDLWSLLTQKQLIPPDVPAPKPTDNPEAR